MEQTHTSPLSRLDPTLADTMLAIGLTVFTWLNLSAPMILVRSGVRFRPDVGPVAVRVFALSPFMFLLAALVFLPLIVRRRFPIPVLVATTIFAAAFDSLAHPPALTVLGPLVALYTVGTLEDRRTTTIAALATAGALLLTSLPPFRDTRWLAEFVRVGAMVAVAASLGYGVRTQRAFLLEAEQRAAEAEARAEEEAMRRVDEERLRIARELHDVTAHSLSVIAVQSGAAAHVIDKDPTAARKALDDIKRTSKEALTELRSVVGSLRSEGEHDEGVPLTPTPGLARVSELIRPLEEAGVHVQVAIDGDLSGLPQLVDASAYRIVQEALTNVVRHAGAGASARVTLRVSPDTLSVEVLDEGQCEPVKAGGHGIAGMRERALALGGTFEAGPVERGWRVAAWLPLTPRRL